MTHPYRIEVEAPRESIAHDETPGASPLVRRAVIEAGISAAMTVLPSARFAPREYALPRPLQGQALPDALGSVPGGITEGDGDVDLVAAFGAIRSLGGGFALGALDGFHAVTVHGYTIGSLPLGSAGWFPLTLDPSTGERWRIRGVLWCRGAVVGTPDRMTVRGLGVATSAPCVRLPTSFSSFPDAVTLTATADAAPGSPVRFTAPDGFPLDGDGNAFEVGALALHDIASEGPLAVFDGSARTAKVLRP